MTTVYRLAYAAGLEPDPDVPVSTWAEQHRYLPPETGRPGLWRNDFAPYLTEILDCLAPSHPCEMVTVMKSSQVGGTEAATTWLAYIVDMTPAPAMVVHPTDKAAGAWIREKLQPTIEATPTLKKKILKRKTTSEDGSTATFKRYPGGYFIISGASSLTNLRQKSVKYVVKDDWDAWPVELGDEGDPDEMVNARMISYYALGAKALQVSTPTLKGVSRVANAYDASDQRKYYVPCPECGEEQDLVFESLKFAREAPYQAEYQCRACGVLIGHHHKGEMLRAGRWVPTNPGQGRQPGYHISVLYSPLLSWEKVADQWWKSRHDPTKLRTFFNLWLGLPWEEKGDVPDHDRLLARREPYKLGTIPPGGLILTCGVDLGKTYLYYEVVAWGIGKTSWSIDYGLIPGDPTKTDLWLKLNEVLARRYPDAYGNLRDIEMTAVDSGSFTSFVYSWARGRPRVMVVKGEDGDQRPVLGLAKNVDVTKSGKRNRRGIKLILVGTWKLKSEFYANLRKDSVRDGAPGFELGYCHFSEDHDAEYFKQLSAETYRVTKAKSGKLSGAWVKTRPDNHALDARIYAMAAAEHPMIRLSQKTPDAWRHLADERSTPPEVVEHDLLTLIQLQGANGVRQSAPPAPASPPPAAPEVPAIPSSPRNAPTGARRPGWLGGRRGSWLNR